LSLLPLVALLVAPQLSGRGSSSPGTRPAPAPRRLLFPVLLGLLQVLHSYPVAGSQMGWAMLSVTFLGGLVVARGIRDAALLRSTLSISPQVLRVASLFVAAVALLSVIGFVRSSEVRWRQYNGDTPLDPVHARYVRIDQPTATTLQTVAKVLKENCSAYYSLPGMGTFSALTQLPQPTGFNATVWPLLFDAADQQHVIADLNRVDHLCVVQNDTVLKGWMQGRAVPSGPLLDHLARYNHRLATVGDYTVRSLAPTT
jgi:hypothetical protein